MSSVDFTRLVAFLLRVPGILGPIAKGTMPDGCWWVKLTIDIAHPLAWRVVQELGHVLNYLSPDDRLPTVFMPVSPPPYMNGGPKQLLAWVIEAKTTDFDPSSCAEWLEGRLPRPIDALDSWELEKATQGAQSSVRHAPPFVV